MNIHEPIYPHVIIEEFISWFTHKHRHYSKITDDPVSAINNGYCYVLAYALQQEALYRGLDSDIVRVRGHWFYRERLYDESLVYYDAFMLRGTHDITDIIEADPTECEVWSCDKVLAIDRFKILSLYSKFRVDRLDNIRVEKVERTIRPLDIEHRRVVDIIVTENDNVIFSDSSKVFLSRIEETIIDILRRVECNNDRGKGYVYNALTDIFNHGYPSSPENASVRVQLVKYFSVFRTYPFISGDPLHLGSKNLNLTIVVR